MNVEGPDSPPPEPKHLLSASKIARIMAAPKASDSARIHAKGQGNGVRTHAIVFAVVSLIVLVGLVVAIGFLANRMM